MMFPRSRDPGPVETLGHWLGDETGARETVIANRSAVHGTLLRLVGPGAGSGRTLHA